MYSVLYESWHSWLDCLFFYCNVNVHVLKIYILCQAKTHYGKLITKYHYLEPFLLKFLLSHESLYSKVSQTTVMSLESFVSELQTSSMIVCLL